MSLSDKMVLNTDYEKFADILSKDVLTKLDGSHENFERIETPDKPSKLIILGTLGNIDTDYSAGKAYDSRRTLTSVKNNSMTVKFLTNKKGTITIKPTLSVYYEVYPTFEEQNEYLKFKYDEPYSIVNIARIWKRKEIKINEIEIDLSTVSEKKTIDLDFEHKIDKIKKDENIKGVQKEIKYDYAIDETKYNQEIDSISKRDVPFNWVAKLIINMEKFGDESELFLISVTLLNNTEENNDYETFLFNCNMDIKLDFQLTEFRYDYEYEGYYYPHGNYLRTLNCHADYKNSHVITKNYCNYIKQKIIPKDKIEGLKLSFDELSNHNLNLNILNQLHEKMVSYLKSYEDNSHDKDRKYIDSVNEFKSMIERFDEGLDTLKSNNNALKSFELLNKTLKIANPYEGWRVFQIVFLISLIPDIVDKEKRRNICEVLHVPTGGGKSEAYFGCVLFSAFWDRINGKEFGVTAITKFPLRMLSIQQLQRISSIFIWAEEIRKNEYIGGKPFSLGYFVGSSDEFPRHSDELIDKIRKAKKEGIETPGKIISYCPICKSYGKEVKVILDYNEESKLIVHKCKECDREFEIYFTDEEIYRTIPTFIVSTVDKLAGISLNRRFRNLFGGKIDECDNGHGFIPHNDACDVKNCGAKGKKLNLDFATAPSLIIQDEMHLIKEGFGTINSHFESLMETLQKKICGYGFKNITMTATITGAKEQIENLYLKKVNLFPPNSPEGHGINDFFYKEVFENNKRINQRYFIGLKPNLRDNQFASLLTLKYISEFIKTSEDNLELYSSNIGITNEDLKEIISNYKSILTYHNKKSDVHSMNYYLNSVVNSKLNDYNITPIVLTGDNTLDEIKKTINTVNTYFDNEKNAQSLLTVFATSIVSHGVDIDQWNIMIFQGIPRSTAEYIQSLSRVGRKFLGVIFVWFYPNRTRDLSFYQNFYDYHDLLDHKVEYVPLSRWTKLGLKQTFTSIFNASIINYFSEILDEPVYKLDKVNEIFSSKDSKDNRKKLIEFIMKAYRTDSGMEGSEYFKKRIPIETEERLNYLATYTGTEKNFYPNALKNTAKKYYKTQYGMRGIQDEVVLIPVVKDVKALEQFERNDYER